MMMNSLDTHALLTQGRQITLPAAMEVRLTASPEKVETLELLQTFRFLPGRRLVALVRWKERLVVMKLFFSRRRWTKHLARETASIGQLVNAGLPTPALLGSGRCVDGRSGFMLLEYLDNGESVQLRWERSTGELRESLLRDVVTLIARCHNAGLLQKDLHLDNFLLQAGALQLLDADTVERHAGNSEGVDKVKALHNLGLFFAQFPLSNDVHVPALYAHYRALRPELQLSADAEVLTPILYTKRMARLKLILNKLTRETTANVCVHDWSHFLIFRRALNTDGWRAFIANPDAAMQGGVMLKDGNSTTVMRLCIDGRDVVVKRYNSKSLWHQLKRLFSSTRAWRSWRNAHMLEMLGIATPAPLLMLERRSGPVRGISWFVTDYVDGIEVKKLLQEKSVDSAVWQQTMAQFRELFIGLGEYAIVHGDTKATNFLSAAGRLTVLDLDAMRQETDSGRYRRARSRDLKRFVRNFDKNPQQWNAVKAMIAQLCKDTNFDIFKKDKGK